MELLESSEDSDSSSDESIDFDSPEKPSLVSRLTCREKRMNQVYMHIFHLKNLGLNSFAYLNQSKLDICL